MLSNMSLPWKRYLIVVAVLALAPILQELSVGIFSQHHIPFQTAWDIAHTATESLVMFFLGCLLIWLDRSYGRKKAREIHLTQAVSIEALAALAEYRDSETGQHLQRIRYFVEFLTSELKKNSIYRGYLKKHETYLEEIGNASLLHDIGKIAVPDEILNKPGRLSEQEFIAMQQHTVIGGEMLAAADKRFREQIGKQSYLALARAITLHHHEKWDGSGYPDGLRGEEIPLAARIVALCDVYDAVTSDRSYKKAWSHQEAVELIRNGREIHFDPAIVDVFLEKHAEFKAIKQTYGK